MALQTGIFAELLATERTLVQHREQRSSLENPQTPLSYPAEWLLDIFNGGRTDSGVRVSELTAFQVSTFLTCIDLIAGKISSLPVHIYERTLSKHGRAIHRVAYDHDYYDLVSLEPNEEMSRVTFLKVFLCHCLAWSNGYAEIQRDFGNGAIAFWPRNPAKTRPRRMTQAVQLEPVSWRPFPVTHQAGELAYETTDGMEGGAGGPRLIPMADMLHVPGLSFDGRIGQSVVWLAREVLGLALATTKFGAKYFANFARPGGILSMAMTLNKEDREKARLSWQEAHGGENSNRVAVMPPGFTWQPTSHNPTEAQSIETQEHLRNLIASIFHVPVRLVGDTTTKTRGSAEWENQELLDHTFKPWIAALAVEWKRKLFPNRGIGRKPKNPFFIDFDVTELIRGDAAAREKFNASGKQWGYLSTNDVRALENLNPIEEDWAEEYWMPVNMTLVDTPVDPTHQDGSGNGDVPPGGLAGQADPLERSYSRLFADAFGRISARETRDLAAFQGCFGPILYAMRDLLAAQVSQEMRCPYEPGAESDRFVAEYLGALHARAKSWTVEAAQVEIKSELRRAARAVRLAVYREAAAQKAKEPILVA